jgi:ABC-type multidrug transport system fused ATPase/permease subunit
VNNFKWTLAPIISKSFKLLDKSDQKKMFIVLILQITMSLLDLIGVALFGFIGALAVAGVQSTANGNRVQQLLNFLHLETYSLQIQTAAIALIAVSLLLTRTFLSVVLVRKTLKYLSNKGAQISNELVAKFLNSGYWNIKESSIQETIYATSYGVRVITLGIIGNFLTLIADIALLLVLTTGLIIINWQMTLVTTLGFGLVGFSMYLLLHKKSKQLGAEESIIDIEANELFAQINKSYREMYVKNRVDYYLAEISKKRYRLSSILAELSFIPLISKYIIEGTVLFGVLVLASMQFLIADAKNAVATLAIFMAAGTRIAPAVLRTQQGLLQIVTNSGIASPTFDFIAKHEAKLCTNIVSPGLENSKKFLNALVLDSVSYKFPDSNELVLRDISIQIEAGSTIAIVGQSGAGKTTLVDLMLGISKPTDGSVSVFGLKPEEFVNKFPGKIAYVPQDVVIIAGSIRSNVELGFPAGEFSDEQIWFALEQAELKTFVQDLKGGLDGTVGENGGRLSGGQKQRLGVARAIVGEPELLILDEATSSLDAETEELLSKSIASLKGKVTVISIAHRLRTISNADQVIYIENGHIIACGSFTEIRKSVKNFDNQIKILENS